MASREVDAAVYVEVRYRESTAGGAGRVRIAVVKQRPVADPAVISSALISRGCLVDAVVLVEDAPEG